MKTFRLPLALAAAIAVMFGFLFATSSDAKAFSAMKTVSCGVTAPTGYEPVPAITPSLTPSLPVVTPAPVPQPAVVVQPAVIVPAKPAAPAPAQPATPK